MKSISLVIAALMLACACVKNIASYGAAAPDDRDRDVATEEKDRDAKDDKESAEKRDLEKVDADKKQKRRKPLRYRDADIVISATKTGINRKETGASVTVITEEDIERSKKTQIVDILKSVPGASLMQSSFRGGIADLYMRGAASNHVAVLIDGVRVNNPASAGHGFDFAHLTTENIERIEIIRGAQSTLYGSDAIGGVVNIITKKGEGNPSIDVRAQGGSFYTFNESVSSSGGTEKAYYSFGVSRMDSKGARRTSTWHGFSKSYIKHGGGAYENTSASARAGVKTVRDSWLSFSIRYTGADINIANSAFEEAKGHLYRDRNLALAVNYEIPVFKWWSSYLTFSYMNQAQRDKYTPHKYDYEYYKYESLTYTNMHFDGSLMGGEWKNVFRIGDVDEITFGASYEQRTASTLPYWWSWSQWGGFSMDPTSSFPIDRSDDTWAAYAQNHLKLLKRIFIVAGVRYTKPAHYGYSIDYTASGSFIVPVTETRFKASVGTGYKTPSLYQIYNSFDRNTNYTYGYLEPERTLTYDAGIEQPILDGRIVLEANYFSIDYKNMITYDTTVDRNGRYWNGDGMIRGAEAVLSVKPVDDLAISGYYTHTRPESRAIFIRGDMIRRPRHQAGAILNYAFLKKGNIRVTFTYVGKRRDYFMFPYYHSMNPYYRLDGAVSWQVIDQLQIYFTVENALNKKYDEVRGYRAAPCAMYGGFRVTI